MTQRVDVAVNPVNDPPTDLVRVPALTVTEGALAGTSAGTIVAIDPDNVSGFAFNLLNDGGGHFWIDPLTGALSVLGASLPAVTTQSSYTIVVQVTDAQGASIDRTFTIGVQSAAVVPPPPPSAEVGTPVTATDHGPTSNTSIAAASTPEDNGQNVLRRTVNVILETESKNRRAPPAYQ